ncbi:MAG: CopG family antitoxin [Phycisphaerales bacterium]
MTTEPKPLPKLKTDKEAEDFVDTADLTEFDMSEFKPVKFEMKPMPDEIYVWQEFFDGYGEELTALRSNKQCDDAGTKYIRADRAEPVNKIELSKKPAIQWLNGDYCLTRYENLKDNDVVFLAVGNLREISKAITAAEQCRQDTVAIPRDVLENIYNLSIDNGGIFGADSLWCFLNNINELLKPYVKEQKQ